MSSSWLCVDVNLVIRLVVDPSAQSVEQIWEQWANERRQFAAPTLLYYEVANALHRYQALGLMSASTAQLALKAALALPIHLHGEPDLHHRALDLAQRFSLPAAYDAHYLALAEHLGGEFWTADGKLARAVQSSLTWVHTVE
jgi:predicted nucleic acid-binding protein